MRPSSPAALYLALAPFGLIAGVGASLAWTSGETAVFLLGFTLLLSPLVWAACWLGLTREHWMFALFTAAAWAAIVPGAWEAEARFAAQRFEEQRPALEAVVAGLGGAALDATPRPLEVSTALSPFGEAWAEDRGHGPMVWFLRRRDQAFVHAPGGAAELGPYTARACRPLAEGWFDCAL